jgi:threonine aldolase
LITRARRARKIFGGAMRQTGVIAAAALYALDHHIDRLAEDHRNAQVIAQAIADTPGLRLEPPDVHTNLVWFDIDPELGTADDVFDRLKARGVLVGDGGEYTLRACTHLNVAAADAERAAEIIRKTLRQPVATG